MVVLGVGGASYERGTPAGVGVEDLSQGVCPLLYIGQMSLYRADI